MGLEKSGPIFYMAIKFFILFILIFALADRLWIRYMKWKRNFDKAVWNLEMIMKMEDEDFECRDL